MLKNDVWSLGLCLLEACLLEPTGELYLEDGSVDRELLAALLAQMGQLYGAHPELCAVVRSMLEYEQEARAYPCECIALMQACLEDQGQDLSEAPPESGEVERIDSEAKEKRQASEAQITPGPRDAEAGAPLCVQAGSSRAGTAAQPQPGSRGVSPGLSDNRRGVKNPGEQPAQEPQETPISAGSHPRDNRKDRPALANASPGPRGSSPPRAEPESLASGFRPQATERTVLSSYTEHLPTESKVISTKTYVLFVERGQQPVPSADNHREVNGKQIRRNHCKEGGFTTSTGTTYCHHL